MEKYANRNNKMPPILFSVPKCKVFSNFCTLFANILTKNTATTIIKANTKKGIQIACSPLDWKYSDNLAEKVSAAINPMNAPNTEQTATTNPFFQPLYIANASKTTVIRSIITLPTVLLP